MIISCGSRHPSHFPAELLERVDRIDSNRSAFLERAALLYLSRLEQSRRDRRDIAIINRNARRLNRGVKDTLEYQILPRSGARRICSDGHILVTKLNDAERNQT